MLPAEAAQSIEECKELIDLISKDSPMSDIFTVSFEMLKSLCTKQLNSKTIELEVQQMELQRNEAYSQDAMRDVPLRRLIYALSQSINNTAKTLVGIAAVRRYKGAIMHEDGRQRGTVLIARGSVRRLDLALTAGSAAHDNQATMSTTTGSGRKRAVPVRYRTEGAASTSHVPMMRNEIDRRETNVRSRDDVNDDGYMYDPDLLPADNEDMLMMPKEEGVDGLDEFPAINQMFDDGTGFKEEPVDDDFAHSSNLFSDVEQQMIKDEEYALGDSPYNPYEEEMDPYERPSGSMSSKGRSSSKEKHPVVLFCPLCTVYKQKQVARDTGRMKRHLKDFHSKTVNTAKLRIDCSCGFSTRNLDNVALHANPHTNCTFTMVKTEDLKPETTPLTCYRKEMTVIVNDVSTEEFFCPFCKVGAKNEVARPLRKLETHVRQRHNKTCKGSGLYFVCSCGYISRTPSDVMLHKKKCADSTFTMMHQSVKPLPINATL